MVDLLSCIRAFDARAKAVMQAKPSPEAGKPDDGRHLPTVECVARACEEARTPSTAPQGKFAVRPYCDLSDSQSALVRRDAALLQTSMRSKFLQLLL
jgi:hypothetical protein